MTYPKVIVEKGLLFYRVTCMFKTWHPFLTKKSAEEFAQSVRDAQSKKGSGE